MQVSKPGEYLLSPKQVSSTLAPDVKWLLTVYPNGEDEKSRGTVSICACLTSAEVRFQYGL